MKKNEETGVFGGVTGIIVAIMLIAFMILVPISRSYEGASESSSNGKQLIFVVTFFMFIVLTVGLVAVALGTTSIFDIKMLF